MHIPEKPEDFPIGKNGIAAIVGKANAGKSTLLNKLLGEKISIVTPIAQTTRNRIRGILTEERGQLVLLDTPGLHKAFNALGKIMNQAALSSIEGVDVVLLIVDGSSLPTPEDHKWMKTLRDCPAPVLMIVNKIDLPESRVADYTSAWTEVNGTPLPGARVVAISAERGDGTDTLLNRIFDLLPEGPQLFPEDLLTDFPRRLAIADVIREKIIRDLHEELPHSVAVDVVKFEEKPEEWLVEAKILVKKSSHKGIIIGHKGRRLRAAKRASEKELEIAFGLPVKLELHIRVEKEWQENFFLLQKMGYRE